MSTEAWYLEPPPCVSLIDCSPASAASPYPKDTLHVSDTAGQETARTYLAFPVGKGLFGGTLTLPIDDAASDGSMTPDQATLQACLVTETFKPVQGEEAKRWKVMQIYVLRDYRVLLIDVAESTPPCIWFLEVFRKTSKNAEYIKRAVERARAIREAQR